MAGGAWRGVTAVGAPYSGEIGRIPVRAVPGCAPGERDGILASLALGRMPTTGGRRISLLMYQPTPAGLTDLTRLFEDGHVAPVIESSYPLSNTAKAFARFGQGQVTGKLLITLP